MLKPTRNLWISLATLVLSGAMACALILARNPPAVAGMPLPMPKRAPLDHRFDFQSAWQAAQIPVAQRFDPPLGSNHAGWIYNAQKFWDMNDSRGGHHMGDDLNGIGGMNTDLGDPIFSIADGLVVYAGEPSLGWGKVVVVAHRVADGRRLESMYAHLSEIFTRPGALVARGERVGTVGTANGNYPAHLHFEVRTGGGMEIGPGYSMNPLNRLDPAKLVDSLRNAAAHDLSPSPLAKLLQSARPPR
ncbi:MAG: M23 family metallopeptidase [Akkermansiaceae bacterium]|nr:M23 family metallopeptidase [Akkermansiaceae bacterium]